MTKWGEWGRGALVAFTALLIFITFLPLWWTDRWWVRLWDFPRLQVAGLLLLAGVGLLLVRARRWRWVLVGAALLALAWQVGHFIAYFPPYPKQVASAENCPKGRQLSLLNANVLLTNQDYGKLLRLVEQRAPDVLLLLEPGEAWAKAVDPLRARFPYRLSEPLENTYGLILLSRLPLSLLTNTRKRRTPRQGCAPPPML